MSEKGFEGKGSKLLFLAKIIVKNTTHLKIMRLTFSSNCDQVITLYDHVIQNLVHYDCGMRYRDCVEQFKPEN